jgi:hypothetical protein
MTNKMNAKTLKALRGSIAKWEAIVASEGSDHGIDNCPLCQMFRIVIGFKTISFKTNCDGCPVKARTGHDGCRGTPYDEWDSGVADTPELVALAQAELDFLKSLLPED